MSKNEIEKFEEKELKDKIYNIRGFQVMLDRDLAELYGVETRILNQAVKRNKDRFPSEFRFTLNIQEMRNIRSQFVILNKHENSLKSNIINSKDERGKHSKFLPYVFTQEGVAMLAGVLKSEIAVKVSIHIIKAFIEMRKFIQSNGQLFQRLDKIEVKLLENDQKFEKVFSALESKDSLPKQGVYFEDQAYSDQLKLDVKKFNEQYEPVDIVEFKNSHNQFAHIRDNICICGE
ncbi:MAG: ORF6N domain-containing protein [Candidatus Delongbacteria bacterium]|nr:ORF6N domain-containing protein [Candidatus Delongbacteria bacterium]